MGEPEHVIRDLSRKATTDVMDTLRRTADLVEGIDRWRIIRSVFFGMIGIMGAELHRLQGKPKPERKMVESSDDEVRAFAYALLDQVFGDRHGRKTAEADRKPGAGKPD